MTVLARATASLVLASRSLIRRRLLTQAGLVFDVVPADLDESPLADEAPSDTARRLAREKARAVSSRRPDAFVIGADQVGFIEGASHLALEKCTSREQAAEQLTAMGGVVHTFCSAAAVVMAGEVVRELEATARVRFRPLSDEDVERYLDLGEWKGTCGGYRIEARGARLVEDVEGDLAAVWGLPLFGLLRVLREEGALNEAR